MRHAALFVVGIALVAAAIMVALYGFFAILYGGDGTADTYVMFGGHEFDADLVGAVALLIAFLLLVAAIPILRRERRLAKPS